MKRINTRRITSILFFILTTLVTVQFSACSDEKTTEPEPPTKQPEVIIAPQPSLYFGHIPQGQSATREFIISNIGNGDLNISSMMIEGTNAGLFELLGNSGTVLLPAYNNMTVPVQFTPTANGDFTSYISIQSNAASSPDQEPLTGAGSSAGAGSIYFERIIGGVDRDGAGSIRLTINDGYVCAGSSDDSVSGDQLASILRIDEYGNTLWYKQYPGAGSSGFTDVIPDDGGGYIAIGRTGSTPTSKRRIYVVKTTEDGDIDWEQYAYSINDGTDDDVVVSIEATTDGGYILAGYTKNVPDGGGVKDALLMKIDAAGAMQWYNTYGTTEGEEAASVQQTADDGYVFAGYQSTGVTGFDVYLVKTDADGTTEWAKTYGGENWDGANSVILADGGGYILAGYSIVGANGRDVYLLKTDADGVKIWEQTYGGGSDDEASAVIRTNDQGYLLSGYTESIGQSRDLYLIKTDNTGNLSWETTYGGSSGESGGSVRMVKNEGYIVCGTTSSYSKDTDVYVLKIDNTGMIP